MSSGNFSPFPSTYFAENEDVLHLLDEAENSMPTFFFSVVNFLTAAHIGVELVQGC